MGISDRDWYRDEGDRRSRADRSGPFGLRPPFERRGASASTILFRTVVVVIAVVIGVKAFERWRGRIGAPPTSGWNVTQPSTGPAGQALRHPAGIADPVDQQPQADQFAPPRTTEVFKCVVDGRVVYSGPSDCRGSMARLEVDAGAPPPAVPPGLTDYQRDMLRSATARIAQDEEAARQEMALRRQQARAGTGECAALETQLRSLDAWARQPLSGAQHDHIRDQRMQLRSRQFSLKC